MKNSPVQWKKQKLDHKTAATLEVGDWVLVGNWLDRVTAVKRIGKSVHLTTVKYHKDTKLPAHYYMPRLAKRFARTDWDAFSGAEPFGEGRDPYIGDVTFSAEEDGALVVADATGVRIFLVWGPITDDDYIELLMPKQPEAVIVAAAEALCTALAERKPKNTVELKAFLVEARWLSEEVK